MAIQLQGSFTSTGVNKTIEVPNNVDSFEVWNYTKADGNQTAAVRFYWQRGMADLGGIRVHKEGAANELSMDICDADNPGFSFTNSADQTLSSARGMTSTSNADPIVFTANTPAETNILSDGDVIRLSSVTTATNLNGIDIEIDQLNRGAGTWENAYTFANTPGGAGANGSWRKVYFDPIFYPRSRFVINVSQAANAVVTTSVSHGYTVGQTVRFNIPSEWGMTELDGVSATITAVTAGTFTLDLDSTGFTAYVFPAAADLTQFAYVAPNKMNTAEALNSGVDTYSDARENQASRSMILYSGSQSPAGQNNDVIYWTATVADQVTNE